MVRVEAKSLFRFKASASTRAVIQRNMGHLPDLPSKNYRHVDRTRYFAELVRLSRTSIADETREEHRGRVLG